MKPFKMKNLISGSSGNCSFLLLEKDVLVLFDLGISYKQLKSRLNFIVDLESDECSVLVLITHEHLDHWNKKTYKKLTSLENLKVELLSPDEEYSTMWEGYSIDSKPFKHGAIYTNFFVVDCRFGYLTDVEGDEVMNILMWEHAYDLEELFIESNYDREYLYFAEQASISNGYNVTHGFERHLSKQEAEYLIQCLEPERVETLHHSSRFYEALSEKE